MYSIARGDFILATKLRRKAFFKKHKRLLRLVLCICLIVFAVRGFEQKASDFSKSYFPAFARQTATKCVCGAVEQVLRDGNYTYGDFASVCYDNGKVSSLTTNAAAINALKNKVVAAAEKEAEKIHNSAMYVPLGAFTGLTLIANEGPKIPLTYCLTGSFSAELVSDFESAGVNQTVHHIKLVVTSQFVTASVDYKDTLTFTTDFEIAQSVLLGGVPTTYGGYFTPIR